jgi:negative regulator of replication initiation
MAKESPIQTVKRVYGSKDKLIDSVASSLKAVGDDASDAKERLRAVSNSKLLKLAAVTTAVKEKYGNRDKLVSALATTLGRAKDSDYVTKLKTLSTTQLFDLSKTAGRRSKKRAS